MINKHIKVMMQYYCLLYIPHQWTNHGIKWDWKKWGLLNNLIIWARIETTKNVWILQVYKISQSTWRKNEGNKEKERKKERERARKRKRPKGFWQSRQEDIDLKIPIFFLIRIGIYIECVRRISPHGSVKRQQHGGQIWIRQLMQIRRLFQC